MGSRKLTGMVLFSSTSMSHSLHSESSGKDNDDRDNGNFQSAIQTNDTAVDEYAFARRKHILKNYHSISYQGDSNYKHVMVTYFYSYHCCFVLTAFVEF